MIPAWKRSTPRDGSWEKEMLDPAYIWNSRVLRLLLSGFEEKLRFALEPYESRKSFIFQVFFRIQAQHMSLIDVLEMFRVKTVFRVRFSNSAYLIQNSTF